MFQEKPEDMKVILGRRLRVDLKCNNLCVSKCLGLTQGICLNVCYAHGLKISNPATSEQVDRGKKRWAEADLRWHLLSPCRCLE